jgi:hypothetical protein
MANEKQVRLIRRLIEKTNAGEVRWEATADDEVYQAAFPSYGVRVERRHDRWQNETEGYVVYVLNQEGTAVDEMRDENFVEADFGRSPFLQLQDLFQGAKRTALGADQALDAILGDLDG